MLQKCEKYIYSNFFYCLIIKRKIIVKSFSFGVRLGAGNHLPCIMGTVIPILYGCCQIIRKGLSFSL